MDKVDPVASALSLAEVLEMILDHLDKRTLLSCRRVSKFWNKGASAALKKRPTWIKVDWSSQSFGRLYAVVNKSQDFPFSGLYITWPEPRMYRDNVNLQLEKYISKFGKLHTHVRLDMLFTKNVNKLLSSFTNMKYLDVEYIWRTDEGLGPFCMPSLRTLSFRNLRTGIQLVLREIIVAAPALEKIENIDSEFEELLSVIWKTKRVDLISSMILKNTASLDVCRKLAASPPGGLTGLSIKDVDSSSGPVVAAMNSILFASQDTLKKLSFQNVYGQQDEIPAVFSQLRDLQITTRCKYMSEIFPLLSSAGFPKLRRIRLDLGDAAVRESMAQNYNFLGQNTLETVNTLELDSHLDPRIVEYLAKMFPRVSHICVKYPDSYSGNSDFQSGTAVWLLKSFSFLKKLHIREFPLNSSKNMYSGRVNSSWAAQERERSDMDEFLTGIPCKEIRTKLGTLPKFDMDSFYSDILRPNGSILQLKRLKELSVSIKVWDNSTMEQLSRQYPFISIISVWYALELLPGLRTTFFCRLSDMEVVKKALEPVEGYVSLVTWKEQVEF